MKQYRSLRLLQWEMVLTSTLLSIPIMVPFYNSIGMDQAEIGLSQALFTIALLMVNVPTGWLADRFSRKFCNAFGDLGCAVSLVLYSQAQDFTQVVLVEILFGISMAFTQGADSGLLEAYTRNPTHLRFSLPRVTARLQVWHPIAQVIALYLGGLIGSNDYRLAIGLSATTYAVGFVLSLCLREEGDRLQQVHTNVLKDMAHVTRRVILHDTQLRWLVFAYAVGREVTHVMVWALTPLLLFAGVPLSAVGVGWIANMGASAIGALLADRYGDRLAPWLRFMLPMVLLSLALIVMSIHLSLATIWLYAALGVAQGWSGSVLMPMIQRRAPVDIQSTVASVTKTASQLLYAPLVWLVGVVGVIDIRLTMVATVIIFIPPAIVIARRLYTFERR